MPEKIEFNLQPKKATRQQVISELNRELKTRWRVYPRWVAIGRISKGVAQKRLTLLMAAIQMLENPQMDLGLADRQERQALHDDGYELDPEI